MAAGSSSAANKPANPASKKKQGMTASTRQRQPHGTPAACCATHCSRRLQGNTLDEELLEALQAARKASSHLQSGKIRRLEREVLGICEWASFIQKQFRKGWDKVMEKRRQLAPANHLTVCCSGSRQELTLSTALWGKPSGLEPGAMRITRMKRAFIGHRIYASAQTPSVYDSHTYSKKKM